MNQAPTWILVISVTFSLSLLWVYIRAGQQKLSHLHALDLSLALMVGALVGGRLLHVFYEQPHYYFQNVFSIFYLWQGGFVFYGGLFGAFLAAWFWSRRYEISPWRWADFFAPVIALSYGLGRVGCFLNGCCYGRLCELPWAYEGRHPTQLYASFWELALVAVLLRFEKSLARHPGALFYLWLTCHGIGRLIMELFREDDRGPMPLGLSLGIWISLVLILFGLFQFKRSVRFSN